MGVLVAGPVGVGVEVSVGVAVAVTVGVLVPVGVAVGVSVAVGVGVGVDVGVGVFVSVVAVALINAEGLPAIHSRTAAIHVQRSFHKLLEEYQFILAVTVHVSESAGVEIASRHFEVP